MKHIFVRASLTFVVLAAGSTNVLLGSSPFIFGGPSSALAPSSGAWSWDGSNLAAYRSAITNTANFGPGGTVSQPISAVTLSSITAGTLAGINVFVSPWWYNTDSASYNTLVVNFFRSGGNLFLLDDDTFTDGVASALGIPTLANSTSTVINGIPTLFSGPFGVATNVSQEADHGTLSASAVTGAGGTVCGTNGSGQPAVACFAPGTFAAGSGAMVITTDVDMISSAYGNVNYSPLNANGIFALNATAFLLSGGVVTAPTSVPALSDWAVLALVVLLIASGTFFIARGKRESAS